MEIYSFSHKDVQIDFTFKKGFVLYTFNKDGKPYGNKIKLPSRGVMDIVSATALLVINAIESIDNLK
jgi:hypothetical protein